MKTTTIKTTTMRATLWMILAVTLTACGIDVKAPKDMNLKIDLDGKALAQQIRQATSDKVPPQYQKFIKDEKLLSYLEQTSKNIKGDCLIPTRSMVRGESQGQIYTFSIAQKCYAQGTDKASGKSKTYRIEFDIIGYINTSDLKYEFVLEEHPDAKVVEVPAEEYESARISGRFIPKTN